MTAADPALLEKDAYSFLSEHNFDEAYRLFKKAAGAYRQRGDREQATLCFASAASCWNRKSEEKTSFNAAVSYENAAVEAEKCGDPEYASMLYKYAAIHYEKDGEFIRFSDCFYLSKEAYRRFLMFSLIASRKIHPIGEAVAERGIHSAWKRLFLWLVSTFSFLIWGHGERPARTFLAAIAVVLIAAGFYTFGRVIEDGAIIEPNFYKSLYFSVVTFTTLGYGDIVPVGLTKPVAMIEAFSGIFVMPLFIIGLARKYLRI